jgi:hypothetical protein
MGALILAERLFECRQRSRIHFALACEEPIDCRHLRNNGF